MFKIPEDIKNNDIININGRVYEYQDGKLVAKSEVTIGGGGSGLSVEDKTKLDGIEEGATADQTASEIKIAYESNADTNALTDSLLTLLTTKKVKNITTDAVNNKLVITYTDATVANLNINDIITDVHVSGATLDATTNVLTLTSTDGGTEVTVDLSDFVNSEELISALSGKADIIHSHSTSDITGLDSTLSNKVTKNEAIIGATKTKITYDSNGLVINGADLVEADLPDLPQSKITNLATDLSNKQDTLVSGTSIKTINSSSILSSGNLALLNATNPSITGSITEQVYNLTGTEINPANGTIQYKTVSANTTFTETLTSGQSVLLRLIGANGKTITFPAMTWVGKTAPVLTANCVIVLWKEQTTLYGAYVGSLV